MLVPIRTTSSPRPRSAAALRLLTAGPAIPIMPPEGDPLMVDSTIVLWGQTLAYTFYCVAMILVVGWIGWRLTKPGPARVKPAVFFTFVGFLTVLGVSLHLITLKTIPWVEPDLHRAGVRVDRVVEIRIAGHEFRLPEPRLTVKTGEKVRFVVTSEDLTYGFGVFRPD